MYKRPVIDLNNYHNFTYNIATINTHRETAIVTTKVITTYANVSQNIENNDAIQSVLRIRYLRNVIRSQITYTPLTNSAIFLLLLLNI